MPPIACEKEELDRLKKLVSPSVVTIYRRKSKKGAVESNRNLGEFINFGTGFVLYSNESKALICTHPSIVTGKDSLFVGFHDNKVFEGTIFLANTGSGHAVLEVESQPKRRCSPVVFSDTLATRQNIFTIATVHWRHKFGLMTGTVSIPNCKAVRSNGNVVYESAHLFAMSCPAGGLRKKECKFFADQIVGAAVFDMKGMVIDKLENSLKAIDAEIQLSRSREGGAISEAGSRKRGREDSASTSIQKSLPLNPKAGGGTEVGKRARLEAALQKLITNRDGRSDDQPRDLQSLYFCSDETEFARRARLEKAMEMIIMSRESSSLVRV